MAKSKEYLSAGLIAATIDRPTPWVEARLRDAEVSPAMILDRVEYYESTVMDALKKTSLELAERVANARREAQSAGL